MENGENRGTRLEVSITSEWSWRTNVGAWGVMLGGITPPGGLLESGHGLAAVAARGNSVGRRWEAKANRQCESTEALWGR